MSNMSDFLGTAGGGGGEFSSLPAPSRITQTIEVSDTAEWNAAVATVNTGSGGMVRILLTANISMDQNVTFNRGVYIDGDVDNFFQLDGNGQWGLEFKWYNPNRIDFIELSGLVIGVIENGILVIGGNVDTAPFATPFPYRYPEMYVYDASSVEIEAAEFAVGWGGFTVAEGSSFRAHGSLITEPEATAGLDLGVVGDPDSPSVEIFGNLNVNLVNAAAAQDAVACRSDCYGKLDIYGDLIITNIGTGYGVDPGGCVVNVWGTIIGATNGDTPTGAAATRTTGTVTKR